MFVCKAAVVGAGTMISAFLAKRRPRFEGK